MKIRGLAFFDYILFTAVLLLVIIGVFFIYSSGVNSEKILVSNEYIKQIVFASSGFLIMILVSIFDYRRIKRWILGAFIALILLLLYTRFFGRYVNGARSWLGIGELGVQPSEFGKVVFILFLAWYLERSENTAPLKRFTRALSIMMIPVLLILSQPDLGTASVYIPIFLVMCFTANLPLRYIMMAFLTGALTVIFTVLPLWQSEIFRKSVPVISLLTEDRLRFILIFAVGMITLIGILGKILFKNKYYYWIAYFAGICDLSLLGSVGAGKVLKDYQIKRLIVFLDPSTDPLGSGWNIIQSKIAIGSGGLFGQGFLSGTQSHYRFLPQQSTDFIFSILSEEWGFVGGIFVFFLFLVILMRAVYIIRNTTNVFGFYIASGIVSMIFFHFIVNVGMVMGIMPITGIPLVFLSYGGSSLWTAMTCIGLLMSINYRRLDF